MGVAIYYIILAAVIVLGRLMPQSGKKKKNYIILMAALHAFVSGFRYKLLTGDLQKYAYTFLTVKDKDWFSEDVFSEGRNFLFMWFLKAVNQITDGNFQIVLIIIAVFIELAVAIVVFKHSPSPWISYLIWNCFGFYSFGFSALKQSFAMGFILLAFSAIMEKKPVKFIIFVVIAGFIHFPAIIFLPAYIIASRKITYKNAIIYIVIAILIFALRNDIVELSSDFYYEDKNFVSSGRISGRFLMLCLIIIAGVFIKGVDGIKFSTVLSIVAIGTIIQLFSSFDNVFTRLADYYLQMLIVFIPMIFTDFEDEKYDDSSVSYKLFLNKKQKQLLTICLVLLSVAFYYFTVLSVKTISVDDYLNFKFSWEVSDDLWDEAVRNIQLNSETSGD